MAVDPSNATIPPSALSAAAVTVVLPNAPSGLSATTISTGEIDLAWVNNSLAANSFAIYRSTNGVSFSLLTPSPLSLTSYHDTSVAAGTNYWYKVYATVAADPTIPPSNYSGIAAATSVPTTPDGLTAVSNGDGAIHLDWVSHSNASTVFQVMRDGVPIGVPASAASYADTDIAENALYSYSVTAIVNGVSSAASTVATVTSLVNIPSPIAHTPISTTEIDLAWTSNSLIADTFNLYRSTDGIAFALLTPSPITATGYHDTGLTEGTHYWYEVCSVVSTDATIAPSGFSIADCWSTPEAPTDLATGEIDANRVNLS